MTFTAAVAAALLMMPPFGAALATGDSRCTTVCGNISIPHPFGVEPGCHLDGFNLTCNQSYHPPKLFLGDGTVQVLDISIPNGTVHINSSRIDLSDPPEPPLTANSTWVAGGALGGGGPYFLSERRNKLVAVGCDVQVFLLGEDSDPVSTCAAFCTQVSKGLYMVGSPDCSGVGCCQATIPAGHASYLLQLRRFNGSWSGTSANVFIVDSEFFSPYPEAAIEFGMATALPAVLDWSINSSMCHSNLSSPECCSSHSFCQNSTAFGHDRGHRCHCSPGYQGNPYVTNGCNDINECDFPEIYPCFGDCNNTQGGYQCQCPPGFNGNASIQKGCKDIDECAHPEAHSCFGICINMPGTFHCRCPHGTYGDPSVKGGCTTIKNSFTGLSIALVVSGGSIFVLLALVAPFITRKIKLRRVKKLKEKYFKQNHGHGLLLQQLISRKVDIGERMIITLRELEKATDNFDKIREVGGGGHGVVYKGILDLHVVAVKKSKIVVQREIDEFINEVAILSQINHRNVVKLLGCCLETEVPLLVYEFISNGTLYRHLHVEESISLSWDDRLRIALEVARALSYLHSAASMPIFHRNAWCLQGILGDLVQAWATITYILIVSTTYQDKESSFLIWSLRKVCFNWSIRYIFMYKEV